jgi:DNA-binding NtrC family response regulator
MDLKPTVLVVDDQDSLRMFLRLILEHEGYDVLEAESGYQAIDLVDKNTVELVMMDVQMPGINGVEAFREIKKVSPDSVTVMMTGFAVGNLLEEAVRDGVHAVMYKPFGAVEAIDMVDSIVGPTSFTPQLSRN